MLPDQYKSIRKRFKAFFTASSNLGKAAKAAGPIDEKLHTSSRLAAAAAIRSEGSVHSHTRRALELGAEPDEILSCDHTADKYHRVPDGLWLR